MTINKKNEAEKLTVSVGGRLDTSTAPELEKALEGELENVKELVIDLSDLEYISSAGLRVLLAAQKAMNGHGSMTVSGANEDIMEVFEITGFSDVLTIV